MTRRGSRFVAGRATNPLAARFREIEQAIRRRQDTALALASRAGQLLRRSPTVVSELGYGQLPDPGSSDDYAAGDHTHGTPVAGASVGWDAVVDYGAVTDTAQRLFGGLTGISDALSYLASIGLNRALVLVRATAPTAYTESGNWTNPAEVHLFGVADDSQGGSTNRPRWNHAGFSGSNAGWALHDMAIEPGSKTTIFSTGGAANQFYAERVYFITNRGTAHQIANHTNATYIDCNNDYMTGMGVNAKLVRHAFGDVDNLLTVTLATTSIIGDWTMGVSITSPATTTVNLPNQTTARSTIVGSGSGNGTVTFANSAAAANIRIEGKDDGISRQRLSLGAVGSCDIRGKWDRVDATGTTPYKNIDCIIAGTLSDITGPGIFALAGLSNRLIIRGEAGEGRFSFQNTNGNLGAANAVLDFINADGWSITAAMDNNGFTGKPYAFDASSNNNVLVVKDLTTFATAGTDAGANNRVLPEGSPPPAGGIAPANADYLVGTAHADLSAEIVVGTTPGGELGGTWASPTVDAIHSGSAHADFIPLAGAPTGWGSITNVTPDQAYDADSTTVDELADVLGTLIADLIARGVLDT